ncbi:cytochrome P450 1A5 [Lingula anatina]|uniref:Steroid 21-hydroxylase n=1 Tax=Lingula anatina TaxID=7574 RepID=A0A1S3GZZ5_LINAN|nr:cytochrome P450 1A5 [Lingula anatina]|eukprot:XP_013379323.1 cytochrome P450 1A5 [Lingula anatina]
MFAIFAAASSTLSEATKDHLSTLLLMFLILLIGLVSKILNDKHVKETVDPKTAGRACPTPPGPIAWPVLGNLLQLGTKPHVTLTNWRSMYGDVYQMQMGSRPTVVLNGLETCRQALVKQAEDFAGRPAFYSFNFIGNGKSMGFCDFGTRWKYHRRIAQNGVAMFVNDRHNPIEEFIKAEAAFLVQKLNESNGEKFNPHNEIYYSVGNIICALCFGKRYRRDEPDFQQLVKMNEEFMAFAGAGNPVDIMPWTRWLTKRSFDKFIAILKTMDNFCLRKTKEHLDTYDDSLTRDITDFLIKTVRDTPQEEKDAAEITDEHIMTTVQEIIGAGFDTIATTLQWGVLLMTRYPEHQAKVRKEIDAIIGQERAPERSDIGTLPFTEACILETMRFSCIFPFALPHSTTRDTVLNGFFIPANTLVFVNQWSITRDESKFPDPEVFDPRRFLTDDGLALDKAKAELFLPYGAGRRRCPGEPLAKIEMFIFFVTLLQKCRFEPVVLNMSTESKYGLTLKPKDFEVYVKPRAL